MPILPIVEARHEARFEVNRPLKVIDLNRRDRQLDCVLVDVSATGLKIVSPENLPEDALIAIEGEDHYALAKVRHVQPRGDRFTIGVARLHVLSKLSLSDDIGPSVALNVLLQEYQNRIAERPEAPAPSKTPVQMPTETPVAPRQLAGLGKPRPPSANAAPSIKLRKPIPWKLLGGLAATAILSWCLTALFWYSGARSKAARLASSVASLIPSKVPATPGAPAPAPRQVQIKATEPVWVLVTADGKRVLNKKLSTSDMREFKFSSQAQVRVGNARGVEITVDGKPIGPIGGRGQVRIVELSLNGSRIVPAY